MTYTNFSIIQREVPISGGSVNIIDGRDVIILLEPAFPLAELDIHMFPNPRVGNKVTIVSTEDITLVTHDTGTILGALSVMVANSASKWVFNNAKWYRI